MPMLRRDPAGMSRAMPDEEEMRFSGQEINPIGDNDHVMPEQEMGQYRNTYNQDDPSYDPFMGEPEEKAPSVDKFVGMIAALGRNGDNALAHVHSGEMMIPKQLLDRDPGFLTAIIKAFQKAGADWRQFMVDGPTGTDDKINPTTGMREYFFGADAGMADRPGDAGFDVGAPDASSGVVGSITSPDAFSALAQDATSAPATQETGGYMFSPGSVAPPASGQQPGDVVDLGTQDTGYTPAMTEQNPIDPRLTNQTTFVDRALQRGQFSTLPALVQTLRDNTPPGMWSDSYPGGPQEQAGVTPGAGGGGAAQGAPSETGGVLPQAPAPVSPVAPPPAQPPAPSYVRPPELSAPGFLGIDPYMTPLQIRAMLATYGLNADESVWRDPMAKEYYKNIIQRMLIDDAGNLQELPQLLPIEQQYISQVLGLPEYSNAAELARNFELGPQEPAQPEIDELFGEDIANSPFLAALGYSPQQMSQLAAIAAA